MSLGADRTALRHIRDAVWFTAYSPNHNKSVFLLIQDDLCGFEFFDGNLTEPPLPLPKCEVNLPALLNVLDIPERNQQWLSFELLRRKVTGQPILELLTPA